MLILYGTSETEMEPVMKRPGASIWKDERGMGKYLLGGGQYYLNMIVRLNEYFSPSKYFSAPKKVVGLRPRPWHASEYSHPFPIGMSGIQHLPHCVLYAVSFQPAHGPGENPCSEYIDLARTCPLKFHHHACSSASNASPLRCASQMRPLSYTPK
jgi:hypothetical protein